MGNASSTTRRAVAPSITRKGVMRGWLQLLSCCPRCEHDYVFDKLAEIDALPAARRPVFLKRLGFSDEEIGEMGSEAGTIDDGMSNNNKAKKKGQPDPSASSPSSVLPERAFTTSREIASFTSPPPLYPSSPTVQRVGAAPETRSSATGDASTAVAAAAASVAAAVAAVAKEATTSDAFLEKESDTDLSEVQTPQQIRQLAEEEYPGMMAFCLNGFMGLSTDNAYEKISLSGSGNFGRVYKARHKVDGNFYAIKTSKPVELYRNPTRAIWEYSQVATFGEVQSLLEVRNGPHLLQLVEFYYDFNNPGQPYPLTIVTEHSRAKIWICG